MDPSIVGLQISLLECEKKLIYLSENITNSNHEEVAECFNVNENLLIEFWCSTEEYIENHRTEILPSLYRFASALSHCNSSLLALNLETEYAKNCPNQELLKSLWHINDVVETFLSEEMKNIIASGLNDVFSFTLLERAQIVCVFNLSSVFSNQTQKLLEKYSSIRSESLKGLFTKWLSETTSKKGGCSGHQDIITVFRQEFELATNCQQNFSPYEFLHSTCLSPLVQTVSEFIRKHHDKERDKEILLDLIYGLHLLEGQLDILFKRLSIGDDQMFHNAEIAAIFKNNSSELMSLLFDETDYSFGSKNFSKQIWHWRIPFLTYLPNIFAAVEQIGNQFCSDIAKCAKVHSKEILFLDGKKYNCIHGTSRFVYFTKSVSLFANWERHNVDIDQKIGQIFSKIQNSINAEASKFPNSLNMNNFVTLLTTLTYCTNVINRRITETGSSAHANALATLQSFVDMRQKMIYQLCDFEKNNFHCFFSFINPYDDYSIVKHPQRNEVPSHLQMWRMTLQFFWSTFQDLSEPNNKIFMLEILEHDLKIILQTYSHYKPSAARRQHFTNHIYYVLRVTENLLSQLAHGPSQLISNDNCTTCNIHALCRKLTTLLITHSCNLEQLQKLCKKISAKPSDKKSNLSWLHFINPAFYPEDHIYSFADYKKFLFTVQILCKLLSESSDTDYLILWLMYCKNCSISVLFLQRLNNCDDEHHENFDRQLIVATSFLWIMAYANVDSWSLVTVLKPIMNLQNSVLFNDNGVIDDNKNMKLFSYYRKMVCFQGLCRIVRPTFERFFMSAYQECLCVLQFCQNNRSDDTFPPSPCGCLANSGENEVLQICLDRLQTAAKQTFDDLTPNLKQLFVAINDFPLIQFTFAESCSQFTESVSKELPTEFFEIIKKFVTNLFNTKNEIFFQPSDKDEIKSNDVDSIYFTVVETMLQNETKNLIENFEGKDHIEGLQIFFRKNSSWLIKQFYQGDQNLTETNGVVTNLLSIIDDSEYQKNFNFEFDEFSTNFIENSLTELELRDFVKNRAEFWDENFELVDEDKKFLELIRSKFRL